MMAPFQNILRSFTVIIENCPRADALAQLLLDGPVELPELPENMDQIHHMRMGINIHQPGEPIPMDVDGAVNLEPQQLVLNDNVDNLEVVPMELDLPDAQEQPSESSEAKNTVATVPMELELDLPSAQEQASELCEANNGTAAGEYEQSLESNESPNASPMNSSLVSNNCESAPMGLVKSRTSEQPVYDTINGGPSSSMFDGYEQQLLRAVPFVNNQQAGQPLRQRRQSTAGGSLFIVDNNVLEAGADYMRRVIYGSMIMNRFDPYQRIANGPLRSRSRSIDFRRPSLHQIDEVENEQDES